MTTNKAITKDITHGDKYWAINDMRFHDYPLKPGRKSLKEKCNIVKYHITMFFKSLISKRK